MARIMVNELAAQVGINVVAGKPATWSPGDLDAVDLICHTLSAQRPGDDDGKYILDGVAPGWLGVAVVHGLHPQAVCLNDPRLGAVEIPKLSPFGQGSDHLTWKVTETRDFNLVQFEIPGGTLDVSVLPDIVPPLVRGDKGVLLNGRGPNWLLAALAMGYHVTRWVATFQPATPPQVQPPAPAQYITCMTHVANVKLGTTILDTDVQADLAAATS